MKLLLVRPKMANTLGFLNIVDCEPLELEYLFAAAKNRGHIPIIYDAMYDRGDLRAIITAEKPDAIAITGYITQENLMIKYARIAKEIDGAVSVILGGVHAELNAERFYNSRADYIVHTGSLETFEKLLDAIDGKIGAAGIPGICCRDGAAWVKNPPLACDPNAWPMPDRTFFYNTRERYRYLEFQPCALLKASYACPYQCGFCYCRKLNCGRYAVRDMEKVVDEIELIPCDNIYIVDDDFLLDNSRVEQFISLLKSRGIHKNFLIYGRADYICQNRDMILKLKEAGVRYIMVGLEASADIHLKSYNKGVDIGQNERCISVLRECGVKCMALMIVNLDFTKEDFNRMRQWIKETGLEYVTVSIFTPLPGTDIFDEYSGRLTDAAVEKFDFLHVLAEPAHMSRREFYLQYYRLFLSIYSIARKNDAYPTLNLKYMRDVFTNYIRTLIKT